MRRVALLLVLLALAGCGGDDDEKSAVGAPRAAVTDLDNVLVLRSDFEADAGKTRALLLFSPT